VKKEPDFVLDSTRAHLHAPNIKRPLLDSTNNSFVSLFFTLPLSGKMANLKKMACTWVLFAQVCQVGAEFL
jgi:hypothetical protein